MFTIRFNSHESPDVYKSYSCRAYFVSFDFEGEAVVRMEFPDGTSHVENVGDKTEYEVAYVTNSDSRTIDVIRQLKALKGD